MTACWVIVVGPAGAGKTTVAGYIRAQFPLFRHISDLTALEQLFAYNDARGEFALGAPGDRPSLWRGDDADAYLCSEATMKLPDGGHGILDPRVWDQALRTVVRDARAEPYVIVEFARGLDRAYMQLHGLKDSEAYLPSLQLLADELAGAPVVALVIVHVTAPLHTRMARNSSRQARGEHYVAEDVMRSIYRDDLFDERVLESLRDCERRPKLLTVDTVVSVEKGMIPVMEYLAESLEA